MDGLWVRGGRMVLALSTLLSWGPPGHAGPIANAPPVELFAAPPLFESPRLSPGGSKLVARMLINGAQSLVVFPLTSGGKPARLKIPDETELNDWRWVNDDWLLLSIGRADRIEGIEIYVTRLAGVNAAFTKWIPIDWERSGISADNVLWIAHDGSTRIIFQKQTGIDREDQFDPTVFEADVATGKVRELVHSRSDISGWYADGNGRVRFGTGHTDRRWTMIYRDATTDKFTSIPNHYAFDQSPPVPLIYRPDGSAVVIDDKSGFGAVRSLALPSFTLGETIFALPDYDVDGVILNPARDGLLGVNYTDHVDHDSWFDADLKTVQQGFDKAVGAGNAHIVSLSRDGHTMLVVVGSAAQAGALYYYDIGEGAMHRLGFNNEQLKNQQLSAVKSIRYRARDGTSIEAVLTLPRGLAAKNLPLIVMPHGGPYARDSEQYDWWVQYLAAQGYAVIQPNYRGSTGYGDAFEKLG